ncbi:recombinase family protein [Bacillus pumilus]|uniref:recombinase family protein n=1 Tax=Bacillus pumilus TaxID=1408 RepID=UPI0011A282FC|nr:recombinase family protein [Bacillus pumilus]
MRTAIYIRVSTNEQVEEGYSLPAQKERLSAFVASQGWDIVGFYIDEGLSAKDMNRDNLQKMLTDISHGSIDVVLVYRLDRLTRSVIDLHKLLEIFDRHNCKFKSATEVYDTTTAIGRLFLTLVAALAQWERENLSERVSFGMTQKVQQGEWHGSPPPLGYNLSGSKLVINDVEANTIRLMFDWYVSGFSDKNIAIKLNEMGCYTKNNKIWRENTVRYILKNPLYYGNLRWGYRVNQSNYFEVEKAVPPIIEKEVFETAMNIRDKRRRFYGKQRTTSDFIFSGILKCTRCGGSFKGHTNISSKGVRRKNYKCIKSGLKQCNMPAISEKIVEANFKKYLEAAHFEYEFTQDEIKKALPDNSDKKSKKEQIEIELKEITRRKRKWQYAWANELITDKEFTERSTEEVNKEKILEQQLDDLVTDEEASTIDYKVIAEYIKSLLIIWDKLSDIEKKQLLQNTVDKIVVEKVKANTVLERLRILEIKFL